MVARAVVIGSYRSSLEAGLAQGILKQAGIPSNLDGLTSQSWLAGEVPLTGFRLLVAQADADQASAVLAEVEGGAQAGEESEEGGDPAEPDPDGSWPASGPGDAAESDDEDGAPDAAGPAPAAGSAFESPRQRAGDAAGIGPTRAADDPEVTSAQAVTRPTAALALGMVMLAPLSILVAWWWARGVRRGPLGPTLPDSRRRLLLGILLLSPVALFGGVSIRWLAARDISLLGGSPLQLGALAAYDVLLALAILTGRNAARRRGHV